MLANYGYSDGSGDYFITIDTAKCNGCGACAYTCPARLFEILDEDPNDPFREGPLAVVRRDKSKEVKYECGPCKQSPTRCTLPCVSACGTDAITHSW